MVGAPGRSTGCKTCRARKIKCDEGTPECQRCQKSGYVCEGYEKDFTIVDQTKKLERKFGQSSSKTHFERKTRTTPVSRRSPGTTEQSLSAALGADSSAEPPDEFSPIVTSVNLTPFQADICMAYLFKSLLHGKEGPFQRILWRSGVESRGRSDALAHTAIQSLATTYFGRMHGNNANLLQQGTNLYGQALHLLRDQIAQPGNREMDIMLASLALYLLEIVLNTDETAWLMHAGGIGRLIERRGPQAFRFQPLHDYFVFCRQRLITRALVTRKRTFLQQPEWQTIPWSVIPKSPLQEILDILCKFPGLMEDLDLIEQNGPEARRKSLNEFKAQEVTQSMKTRLTQCYANMVKWRHEWEERNSDSVYETTPLEPNFMTRLKRPECVETVYYYSSPDLAKEILTYHVTRTCCLYFPLHLPDFSYDLPELWDRWREHVRGGKRNPLKLPLEDDEVVVSIIEIMKSIDYCVIDHEYRLDMLALLVPALRTCMLTFFLIPELRDPDQMAWVSAILEWLTDETGLEFYRRMVLMPPVGYYEDDSGGESPQSYSFSNPKANIKKNFLPLRPGRQL